MVAALVLRIAIVGAAGAIGHAVASELRRRQLPHRVIGRHCQRLEAAFGATAEIAVADVGDMATTQRALRGVVAFAAHGQRGLRTLVLRLPDFYGPHAELSLADQVFAAVMKAATANWIGPA